MVDLTNIPERLTRIAGQPPRAWALPGVAVALLCAIVMAVAQLELRFSGLERAELDVDGAPVTLYRQAEVQPGPLVVMTHGFGGSRQMMDQLSVTLARSGFQVAAFDFPGHGRNANPMSADVSRIEGTTEQLINTTIAVATALQSRLNTAGPISFVGHSMATDVIIRAAERLDNVAAVAAISMYSEAITAEHPTRLLVVSGAREQHLREAGLRALADLTETPSERVTVQSGDVVRRSVVAPFVGHVGVLYSATTLSEVASWLSDAHGLNSQPRPDLSGLSAGFVLVALTLLAWPISRLLPKRDGTTSSQRWTIKQSAVLIAAPIIPTAATAALLPATLGPYPGFVTLAAALAIWGAIQITLVHRFRVAIPPMDATATGALLAWGILVFGLALDRYGAAFVPSGPRVLVFAILLFGTLPAMVGDRLVADHGTWWQRLALRAALIITLGIGMGLSTSGLALTFTVLPVLVLFFVVYGSFARWIAARRGPASASVGVGLVLAWAIAASTPLFAGAPTWL